MNFPKIIAPNPTGNEFSDVSKMDEELSKSIDRISSALDLVFANGVGVSDNLDCRVVSLSTSATPDAENTVAHSLSRVPSGYIVVKRNKAAIVYDGTTTWTKTNIYVKCDVASTAVTLIIF
jgi:hypothetical protein